MQGSVSFVSLGPGDPELITIKALNALKDADVVIVPATARNLEGNAVQGQLNATSSRAAEIIRYWDVQAKVRTFAVPMSRDRLLAQRAYDDICVEIAQFYRDHLRVAVAVEGDVSIYASIHYVMERLQTMGIPVEQLPGITSFIAAAAESRLSLTSHQESLHVIPGTAHDAEMDKLLANGCTLVIMKLSQCEEEVKSFMASHQDYEYHYFENVGATDSFYTSSVTEIAARKFPYFSLMIIKGDVGH
ncbi:MAG: precorrin-2 C(20)-methyltransferase [Prevotella sp.]|nr:precorrin-2 C(20)-methyltransferase [Prevotella sp.]